MSDRLLKMVSDLYAGLRVLEEAVREEPGPDKAEQPDRFEHTDADGDELAVVSHGGSGAQYVRVNGRTGSLLNQAAVNGLAQYLDRYRTDTACDRLGSAAQCAGTQHHDGPCSPDADDIGAPVTYPLPTGPDRCAGMYQGFRCRRLVDHEGGHA